MQIFLVLFPNIGDNMRKHRLYGYVCLSVFRTFINFTLRTSTFRQTSRYSDT